MRNLNEIKIVYKRIEILNQRLRDSHQCYHFIKKIYDYQESNIDLKEYFYVILLRKNNSVIGFHKISEGGLDSTIVDLKILFSVALKCLASGIILVHNHPSGNCKPSDIDIKLTIKIQEASKLLDICLIDHLIITSSEYYSLAENGML